MVDFDGTVDLVKCKLFGKGDIFLCIHCSCSEVCKDRVVRVNE